jgi:hypothetical protein
MSYKIRGATMTSDTPTKTSARDHLDVVDAIYRFGAGVDFGDAELLATAFHQEAVVDFRPCGLKMGLNFPVLTGGTTIVGFLSTTAATQLTTHVITNARIRIDADKATLRALVDATHLPKHDHSRRCQMMNWYEIALERHADQWRIRSMIIENAWFAGDPQVLMGK